jgi:hypothetical protein
MAAYVVGEDRAGSLTPGKQAIHRITEAKSPNARHRPGHRAKRLATRRPPVVTRRNVVDVVRPGIEHRAVVHLDVEASRDHLLAATAEKRQ